MSDAKRFHLSKWLHSLIPLNPLVTEDFDSLDSAEVQLDEYVIKAVIIDREHDTFRVYVRDYCDPPEYSNNPDGWHTTQWLPLSGSMSPEAAMARIEELVEELDDALDEIDEAIEVADDVRARLKAISEGRFDDGAAESL